MRLQDQHFSKICSLPFEYQLLVSIWVHKSNRPLLTGHVTSTYWSCELYWLIMWPLLTGHVTSTYWSCELYLLVMWPLLNGHVTSTYWSCDLYLLVVWTLLTDHVTITYWSCDLYLLVMWTLLTGHVTSMEGWNAVSRLTWWRGGRVVSSTWLSAAVALLPWQEWGTLQWQPSRPETAEWLPGHTPNNGCHDDHCIPRAGVWSQSPLRGREEKGGGEIGSTGVTVSGINWTLFCCIFLLHYCVEEGCSAELSLRARLICVE